MRLINDSSNPSFLFIYKSTWNCYGEKNIFLGILWTYSWGKNNNVCKTNKYCKWKWMHMYMCRSDIHEWYYTSELLAFFPLGDVAILFFSWRVWYERVPSIWSAFTSTGLIWPGMLMSVPGWESSSGPGNILNLTTFKILPWVLHYFLFLWFSLLFFSINQISSSV